MSVWYTDAWTRHAHSAVCCPGSSALISCLTHTQRVCTYAADIAHIISPFHASFLPVKHLEVSQSANPPLKILQISSAGL